MTATSHLAIKKPEASESKRIQLTSPILHIGSEVSRLNPFEYVQTSKSVYLPDREALAKALNKKKKLQEYIRRIEDREEIISLLKDAFGDDWQTEKFDNELIFPKTGISRKWTKETIKDLHPMIRNGMGQLYIPGSSIKGAIRTAIAYHLLKYADRYQVTLDLTVSEIEQKLRDKFKALEEKRQQDIGEGKPPRDKKFQDKDKKELAKNLFMKKLFSDFALKYEDNPIGSTNEQTTDFMRAIKVTDSKPLIQRPVKTKDGRTKLVNIPVVTKVIVSSFANFRTKEGFIDELAKYKAPIYAEMVSEVLTEFTITLDTKMLSWFHHNERILPFKTVEDILNICQEFARDQWEYESQYWQGIRNNSSEDIDFDLLREEFYARSECPYSLRIGWGSGLTGTTIGLLLEPKLRAEIRDACGLEAPGYEAPKSRRTVVDNTGEIKFAPGWVTFRPRKKDVQDNNFTT